MDFAGAAIAVRKTGAPRNDVSSILATGAFHSFYVGEPILSTLDVIYLFCI